jgi:D-xylose transport system substrate-binding protein
VNTSADNARVRWRFRVGSGLSVVLISASLVACSGSGAATTAPSAAPATAAPSVAATTAASAAASAPATAAASAAASTGSSDVAGKVAFMLPDNTTPRWTSQDGPSFEKWMKQLAPNVQVITNVANNDPQQQLSQAQAAIAQGAKVLVVVAVDGTQAAKIVETASAANVPVIAYTRQIQSPTVKYMIGDDPGEIGNALGTWTMANTKAGDTIAVIAGSTTDSFAHIERDGWMKVLQPAVDAGSRKVVGDVWTPGWDPVKAHGLMEQHPGRPGGQ